MLITNQWPDAYQRVEDRIAELRQSIKAARASYERRLALVTAERDQKMREAMEELLGLHELAAAAIRELLGSPEARSAELKE